MLISPAQIAYCIQIVHAHTMLMLPIIYYPIMFIVVAIPMPFVALEEIRSKYFNRIIFGQLNINCNRNKMKMLTLLIIGKIDILCLYLKPKLMTVFLQNNFYCLNSHPHTNGTETYMVVESCFY